VSGPIAGGRAIIAGGRTVDGKPTGQVLLFDPEAARPVTIAGEMGEPRYLHTADILQGREGDPLDDFVVIAGGTDGNQSLKSLEVVRMDPSSPGRILVETLDSTLLVPRIYHSATQIPPNFLLIDGGRYYAPRGGGGIVMTAELLSFKLRGGKMVVSGHWEFPTLARMNHSSTYLGKGTDGAHYILNYGGFGMDPQHTVDPGQEPYFNWDEGVVLAAPELIRIDLGGEEPQLSRIPLENYGWSYQKLRHGHDAVRVGFDPNTIAGDRARQVLIAGGSLYPPYFDRDRPNRKPFEPPHRAEDMALYARSPDYSESADALLIEVRPDEPDESTIREVPSRTGNPRVHIALAPLEHPGVLILGGENPDPQRSDEIYITAEIFLYRERRLAPLAIPLATSRSRLETLVLSRPGGAMVYALGGMTMPEEESSFADIELLNIHWKN
jgi:hypothetical protein